jgi:hypothetical protein
MSRAYALSDCGICRKDKRDCALFVIDVKYETTGIKRVQFYVCRMCAITITVAHAECARHLQGSSLPPPDQG